MLPEHEIQVADNPERLLALTNHNKGTYILVLRLPQDRASRVGRLGRRYFSRGYYAYVGSALGPGGLGSRLRHHARPARRCHWHVDYLRLIASLQAVWWREDAVRWEHAWAAWLQRQPGVVIPVSRFGASDCHCASHLFHFQTAPTLAALRAGDLSCI